MNLDMSFMNFVSFWMSVASLVLLWWISRLCSWELSSTHPILQDTNTSPEFKSLPVFVNYVFRTFVTSLVLLWWHSWLCPSEISKPQLHPLLQDTNTSFSSIRTKHFSCEFKSFHLVKSRLLKSLTVFWSNFPGFDHRNFRGAFMTGVTQYSFPQTWINRLVTPFHTDMQYITRTSLKMFLKTSQPLNLDCLPYTWIANWFKTWNLTSKLRTLVTL